QARDERGEGCAVHEELRGHRCNRSSIEGPK
ncbi:MAG: hypothetical protein ACI9BK_001627, partial [Acidimicrobiales bacterium]